MKTCFLQRIYAFLKVKHNEKHVQHVPTSGYGCQTKFKINSWGTTEDSLISSVTFFLGRLGNLKHLNRRLIFSQVKSLDYVSMVSTKAYTIYIVNIYK